MPSQRAAGDRKGLRQQRVTSLLPEAWAAVENSPWRKLWLQEEKCQGEWRTSPSPPEGLQRKWYLDGQWKKTPKGSTMGGQSSHRSMPGGLDQEPETKMIDSVVGFLLGDDQSNRRCWLMLRKKHENELVPS